jgi:hypothetical protein
LTKDLELVLHQRNGIVFAFPNDQALAGKRVAGNSCFLCPKTTGAVWSHIAETDVVPACLRSVCPQGLAEYLVLALVQVASIVITSSSLS